MRLLSLVRPAALAVALFGSVSVAQADPLIARAQSSLFVRKLSLLVSILSWQLSFGESVSWRSSPAC